MLTAGRHGNDGGRSRPDRRVTSGHQVAPLRPFVHLAGLKVTENRRQIRHINQQHERLLMISMETQRRLVKRLQTRPQEQKVAVASLCCGC